MPRTRSQSKSRTSKPNFNNQSDNEPAVARGESLIPDIEKEHHSAVFFFFPQFIGYIRMIALLTGFYFIHKQPKVFVIAYCLSFGLDVIDGPVARSFGQSSRFGAALDMLTDKMSTPALLIELALLYPTYRDVFRVCLLLDIISHYFLLQNTLLSKRKSHKDIAEDQTFILRMFYGVKWFFAFTCLGHEFFTISLFLNYHWPHLIFQIISFLTLPSFVTKTVVHVFQLVSSCEGIAKLDVEERHKQRTIASKSFKNK